MKKLDDEACCPLCHTDMSGTEVIHFVQIKIFVLYIVIQFSLTVWCISK